AVAQVTFVLRGPKFLQDGSRENQVGFDFIGNSTRAGPDLVLAPTKSSFCQVPVFANSIAAREQERRDLMELLLARLRDGLGQRIESQPHLGFAGCGPFPSVEAGVSISFGLGHGSLPWSEV